MKEKKFKEWFEPSNNSNYAEKDKGSFLVKFYNYILFISPPDMKI